MLLHTVDMVLPMCSILSLIAVLVCFRFLNAQDIQITVGLASGDTSPAVFNALSLDRANLLAEAQFFCASISGSADCTEVLTSEVLNRRSHRGLWNYPQLVLHHFTADLVAAECQSWSIRGYSNPSDCFSRADTAIRSVKVANAFPAAEKLIRTVNDNAIIPMAANWKDDIEGNTIGFIRKVHFLQALADDVRVERIAEIGFNLGHSVRNSFIE